MGTVEVNELLSYIVPLLVAYNVWIHNKLITAEKDIAVNSSKDSAVNKQYDEIKADIKALADEFHAFVLAQK